MFVAGPNKHDVFTRVSDLAEILTTMSEICDKNNIRIMCGTQNF